MRTKNVGVTAIVLCLALFVATPSQAFYNPSTGRWLNRDALEEAGGMNIVAFLVNDGLNSVDALGLKTVRIVVAEDKTVQDDWNYEHKVVRVNEEMRITLQDTLERCIQCSEHIPPKVILIYEPKRFFPTPENHHWTVGNESDETLMVQNWRKITPAEKNGVPVFWTKNAIVGSRVEGAAGIGYAKKGIILSFDHWFPIRKLLAHEVGHFAGYSGHSSNPQNVMSYGLGNDPDPEYCEKVMALAR